MKPSVAFSTSFLLGCCLAVASCGRVELASRFVKSQTASQDGATFTVTAEDSLELGGTTLAIPQGALSTATTLTLETGPSLVAAGQSAGPVAMFGPSGLRFNKTSRLTLPYALPAGKTTAELNVIVREGDGSTLRIASDKLTLDTARKLVSFNIDGFSSFQANTEIVCTRDADCRNDAYCTAGGCEAIDAGPACVPDPNEKCNGIDDDCDGVIDEGLDCPLDDGGRDGGSYSCTDGGVDGGKCSQGEVDGGAYCAPIACGDGGVDGGACFAEGCLNDGGTDAGSACVPEVETCNGIDDNCDGQVDENLVTQTCGIGACRATVCVAPGGQCVPLPPKAEVCNGVDDDCDGVVDGPSCLPLIDGGA